MQTKNSLLELRWRETRTVSSFHFRILYKLTPEVTLLMTFSVASQNDVASFPSPLARALAHFKANELTEFKPASSTSDCNNNHIPTTWNVSLPLTTQMNFYYNVCNNISLTMQPIQIYDMKCRSAGLPLSSGFTPMCLRSTGVKAEGVWTRVPNLEAILLKLIVNRYTDRGEAF